MAGSTLFYVSTIYCNRPLGFDSSSARPLEEAEDALQKTCTEFVAWRPCEVRSDIAAQASELLKGAPSSTSWAWPREVLTGRPPATGSHPSCKDSTISSSAAVLETAERTGRDIDENGGELNLYFTTSTYASHISLTFSIVAGITAEVKPDVTTWG